MPRLPLHLGLLALPCLLGCTGTVFVETHFFEWHEQEPNNDEANAQWLGWFDAGLDGLVHGQMCAAQCDPADGYTFTTQAPVAIDFVLRATDPTADLDLCAFDAVSDVYFACYQNDGPIESGTIYLGAPTNAVHLVVSPYYGGGEYTLELHVSPIWAADAALPPAVALPRNAGARAYALRAEPELAPIAAHTLELVLDEQGAIVARRELALTADGRAQGRVAWREP